MSRSDGAIDLLVVGSVAYDTVETPEHTAERVLGGSASFFSVAASRLCRPGLVAVVGDDFDAAHVDLLRSAGVDLSGLERRPGRTFFWRGRYAPNLISRTSLATELGVFADFVPDVPQAFRQVPYLFLANIHPELQLQVLDQVERPRFVGMDTMDFWIEGNRSALLRVLARVDGLFINDEEAMQLTGQRNTVRAARDLQSMGPPVVVIKKGEHGSMMFARQDVFFAPAFPLEVVRDPTGAGDTFAGGFMGLLAASEDIDTPNLRRAALLGTLMASFCVEDFSLDGLGDVTAGTIRRRFEALRALTEVGVVPNVISGP